MNIKSFLMASMLMVGALFAMPASADVGLYKGLIESPVKSVLYSTDAVLTVEAVLLQAVLVDLKMEDVERSWVPSQTLNIVNNLTCNPMPVVLDHPDPVMT